MLGGQARTIRLGGLASLVGVTETCLETQGGLHPPVGLGGAGQASRGGLVRHSISINITLISVNRILMSPGKVRGAHAGGGAGTTIMRTTTAAHSRRAVSTGRQGRHDAIDPAAAPRSGHNARRRRIPANGPEYLPLLVRDTGAPPAAVPLLVLAVSAASTLGGLLALGAGSGTPAGISLDDNTRATVTSVSGAGAEAVGVVTFACSSPYTAPPETPDSADHLHVRELAGALP